MSEKRFKVSIGNDNSVGLLDNSVKLILIKFSNKEDAISCRDSLKHQCNLLNELYNENEQLRKTLEDVKKEKDHYVDLYNKCSKRTLSDDDIRRLYSRLQAREYDKHCSGHHTYVYTKDEWNPWQLLR